MLQVDEIIDFYYPTSNDGFAVNKLISESPPLDTNSMYCNLLQCTHFSETSICAKAGEKLVGFISGYLIPTRPNTLFIWQVAVAKSARGRGVASRMLDGLLKRPITREVKFMETTITPDNKSSWMLFQKLADKRGTKIDVSTAFDKEKHFKGSHETEQLLRIGPLS